MYNILSNKSQTFSKTIDDIKDRFCTCDNCGRHVHVDDKNLTINIDEYWYCSNACKNWDKE